MSNIFTMKRANSWPRLKIHKPSKKFLTITAIKREDTSLREKWNRCTTTIRRKNCSKEFIMRMDWPLQMNACSAKPTRD